MERKLKIIISASAAASVLAFSALGQDTSDTKPDRPDYTRQRTTTNRTTEVDNTARNVRERDGRTLTPLNQGNSPGKTCR